jgi:hypothetical protein
LTFITSYARIALHVSSSPTTRRTVVIGVCLKRDTYDAFVKRIPKSKRERSKIIDLLLQKFLKGDIVLNQTY